jgi:hypothetical protein
MARLAPAATRTARAVVSPFVHHASASHVATEQICAQFDDTCGISRTFKEHNTMSYTYKLADDAQALIARARNILDGAKSEGRHMTDDEAAEVEQLSTQAQLLTTKARQQQRADVSTDRMKQICADIGYPIDSMSSSSMPSMSMLHAPDGTPTTWADELRKSASDPHGRYSVDRLPPKLVVPFNLKASITGPLRADTPVPATLGGQLPQQPLPLLALIPQEPIDASWEGATGGGAGFVTETARNPNAAPVDPHTTKPESAFTFARGRAPIVTVATVVSDIDKTLLDDYQGLQTILNSEFQYALQLSCDQQIVNGTGVVGPPQQMTGILHTPGVVSVAFAANALDTVASAISQLQASGVVPNAVAMSSGDALAIQTTKDLQNRYLGNGPFQAGPLTLWSLPLVVDPTIPAGLAIVAQWNASTVWVRQTALLEFGYDQGTFKKNEIILRGETRLGFAVVLPAFFAKVALNNTVVIPTVAEDASQPAAGE